MRIQKLLPSFVDRRMMIVALMFFVLLFSINFIYAQNNNSKNNSPLAKNVRSDLFGLPVESTIAIIVAILGLGGSLLAHLIDIRGLPPSNEQEVAFRKLVTNRLQKLAKDSWTEMREHPENLNSYWEELSKGHIPTMFQDNLKSEAYEYALSLKGDKDYRNIAKNLTETGLEKILKDLRTNLKNDYQKRMLDVIPKLVSIAVDSAYEPKVTDVMVWSKHALENLKPLLLSMEAIDTEINLMIIIKAEINRKLQTIEG